MIKVESFEDDRRGVATYEFTNGERVCLPANAVREDGVEAVLRGIGRSDLIPRGRVPVMQHGQQIGTVVASFDPFSVEIVSPLYDMRRGDWTRDGSAWVASPSLGAGDLEAVNSFEWDAKARNPRQP